MKTTSAKCIVLMYHRIEEPDTDPWNICVSPEHFEEQILFLKQHLPVISTGELLQQLSNNWITENSVCITFDDGYADNVTNALPVLEKNHCPATFFIATSFMGSAMPYWWDELEMICLHAKKLQPVLQVKIRNKVHNFFFETELTEEQWKQHRAWRWYDMPPTQRCNSFLTLWNLLRPMSQSDIAEAMNVIRNWSNTCFYSRLPADAAQLQLLFQNKLATIGLHTHSHIDLMNKSQKQQTSDVLKGKEILAEQYNINANLLAYPYGRFDNNTIKVFDKLGLKAAFTTEPEPVTIHSNLRQLGRYGAGNWCGNDFKNILVELFRD